MSEPYTPSTKVIRAACKSNAVGITDAEFARWLDQVRAEAWDEGWEDGHADQYYGSETPNPYRSV